MKKIFTLAAIAAIAVSANAQQAVEHTNFGSNWSIGLNGGVVTPMTHHAFFGDMRGTVGLNIDKKINDVFGFGVEGYANVNTSSWGHDGYRSSTAFDSQYVGAYGTVNLANLFLGYSCDFRHFGLDAVAGAGWGHEYWNKAKGQDWNYFATKVGLNINWNVNPSLTLALKPAITWNMSDAGVAQTSAAYNINKATFSCAVGVQYNFGPGFKCVTCGPDLSADLAAANARINDLRGEAAAAAALAAANQAKADQLAAELAACKNRKPEVVKEVNNNLNSVRYVFYKVGSSVITADQMPNVEMIAAYLKNHKDAKVEVKGYASPEGNLEFNIKLAEARAQSVKTALVNKYKIDPSRISAEGQGIGNMFSEESWNRVSICTIED